MAIDKEAVKKAIQEWSKDARGKINDQNIVGAALKITEAFAGGVNEKAHDYPVDEMLFNLIHLLRTGELARPDL